ncbi:hypothetical protein [Haematomicrobium sanguinis]|uniref:hypothetical protein n=1 Tax=Haematomicrobium sanguinis TaxID=479106 RepID=UPI000479702B|nr:hypothetical protein [Haematomicrobium sanguinis]
MGIQIPAIRTMVLALTRWPIEIDLAIEHLIFNRREVTRLGGDSIPRRRRDSSGVVQVSNIFESEFHATTVGYSGCVRRPEDGAICNLPQTIQARKSSSEREQDGYLKLPGGIEVRFTPDESMREALSEIYGSVQIATQVEEFYNWLSLGAEFRLDEVSDDLMKCRNVYEATMRRFGVEVDGWSAEEVALRNFGAYRTIGEAPCAEEQLLAIYDFRAQTKSGVRATIQKAFFDSKAKWLHSHEQFIEETYQFYLVALRRSRAILFGGGARSNN